VNAMSDLRVFLSGDDTCDWVLTDDVRLGGAGHATPAAGDGTPYSDLPRAARVVAIVPAQRMRTLCLPLPPTSADKRLAVVRFALEDQLAGDIDAQHVVVAGERGSATVVHAIDRGWLVRIVAILSRQGARPAAIVAESDLVPMNSNARVTWVWHDDGGFLVAADGRVSILDRGGDALPSGLLLALRNAPAESQAVVVRGPEALAQRIDGWSRATGMRFELAPPWSWRDADPAAIAAAPNLLTPDLESGANPLRRERKPRWLRRALWWAAAALLLHAGASIADWAALKWRVAQTERETRDLIHAAAPELSGDLDGGWRRVFAASRHRQGRAAPDDALPMLADTASSLTDLPAGALRVINYEAGQLTLDFDKSAAPAIASSTPGWDAHGLSVLQATTANGLRARLVRK